MARSTSVTAGTATRRMYRPPEGGVDEPAKADEEGEEAMSAAVEGVRVRARPDESNELGRVGSGTHSEHEHGNNATL